MANLSFASCASICAVLAGTTLQSTAAAADPGQWNLEYSFLCWAWDIAVDSQHNVYALDWSNDRIRVFTAEGQLLREETGFVDAIDIAIDENDEIYLLNWRLGNPPRSGWVARYDREFKPLGGWMYGLGDLEMGYGIDVEDGIAYIAAVNDVFKFTTEGTLLARFPGGMKGVSIASDGSIWCTNIDIGIVRHYAAEGNLLAEWETVLSGEETSDPYDLAVDSNQRIFVADATSALKIFRANGKLDDTIPVWPWSVALDGDEVLYVGAEYPLRLMKFTYGPVSVEPVTWGHIKATFR